MPARRSNRIWWLLLILALVGGAILWALISPKSRLSEGLPTTASSAASLPDATTALSPVPANTALPAATAEALPTEPPPTESVQETVVIEEPTPTTVATITPLATIVGVVITPTILFGAESNFIQNGDFADDWANGWTLESRGTEAAIEIRHVEPEPPVLRLEKFGAGVSRLAQRSVLTFPVEGITFRGDIELTGTSDGANEGRSALILRYEDANGDPLGSSVWLDGSTNATDLWGISPLPSLGPNVSLRFVDEGRQSIEIQLGRELTEELSGVDMVSVRQITILLALLSDNTCRPDDCRTILEAGQLSLTAEAP